MTSKLSLKPDALVVTSFAVAPDGAEPFAEISDLPGGTRYCSLDPAQCGTGYTDCPCA
jgi:hypothetical protein